MIGILLLALIYFALYSWSKYDQCNLNAERTIFWENYNKKRGQRNKPEIIEECDDVPKFILPSLDKFR